MLVFMSDIHLTDGMPEGRPTETIHSGAFRKFAQYLTDMAQTAKAKEIQIVLLGDVLDVIRSEYWLRSSIRPWATPGDRDGEGKGLKDYGMSIVDRICQNSVNQESMAYLQKFTEAMAEAGVPVEITYIPGNHDWLVNRYPETRRAAATFLGLRDPNQYQKKLFQPDGYWPDYRVFARHGDIYDPFNFSGTRDASSLGDAIVIDLLNKFPLAVEQAIGSASDPGLIAGLRQIDNVRPLMDVPLWVQGLCRKAREPATAETLKEVWNDCVDSFLKSKYVKSFDKRFRLDIVDCLQIGLKISTVFSLRDIAKCRIRDFFRSGEAYANKAFQEEHMRRNLAEYVVYGHTHAHQVVPLDLVSLSPPAESLAKTYFNCGTWRRVQEKTAFDPENCEFLGRHVMTFIAFYLKDEREGYRFEVWNGALG
jgi:UDP-2,3-diacylglucosamine pyrophosphatase LpxH